ncbi:MAG TPA: LCP family protein [Candidatus Limnocylindria bacterium]|nr:LCP family protein [Candidatus Limnocylindria bacterium]
MTQPARHRHPALAATLSFLLPGLGQAYAGQPLLAAMLAIPVLLLIAGGLLVALVWGDQVRNSLFSATFLTGLLILDLALMVWRVFAIAHVGFARPVPVAVDGAASGPTGGPALGHPSARAGIGRAASIGLVGLLIVATVVMHTWAGMVVTRMESTLDDVFGGIPWSGGRVPGGGDDERPLNEPEYAWDGTERISFLLLGIDAAPGREHALTDTILVVSVDPAARTAVMVSVPRDTGFVPLPDRTVYPDGVYPGKINQLSSEAAENVEAWCPDLPPDAGAACGVRTLERAVSLYLGIPIQYYAQVDLAGFQSLVDAVGGLDLCLQGTLVDPQYLGVGTADRGITLPAGCTHYDGARALAYARIRQGWMEMSDGTRVQQDDFMRAERQQRVLLEFRRELARLDLIFELPPVLEAIGRTVVTDFPREQAGDLATLLPLITGPDIERVVLGLPEFVDPPVDPTVNYLLIPRREQVRAEMERLFGAENLEGWYLTTDAPGPPG